MNAALIGLLGVILGGILSGGLSMRLERQRRRKLAVGMARALSAQLDSIATYLSYPSSSGGDVPPIDTGDLPSIAVELPDSASSIARASAMLDRLRMTDDHKDESKHLVLEATIDAIGTIADESRRKISARGLAKEGAAEELYWRTRWLLRPTGRIGAVVVAGLLVSLLFIPRTFADESSIAGSLESAAGPSSVAECDSVSDDWDCRVAKIDQSHGSCIALSAQVNALPAKLDLIALTSDPLPRTCSITAETRVEVTEVDGRFLALPRGPTSGADPILLAMSTGVTPLQVDQTVPLWRLLLQILGIGPNQ